MCIKRMLTECVLGMSLAGLLLAPAWAAEPSPGQNVNNQQTQQMSQGTMRTQQNLTLLRTTKLIGQTVNDPQGEKLGTIHDLVLTPDCQGVSYIAVSSGGMFGMGSKLYAVPWSALRQGAKNTCVLDISKQKFESMEAFTNDHWPAEASALGSSMSARPLRPSSQQSGQMALENRDIQSRRVSKLTGMEIKNNSGEDIGDVEGFVITANETGAWTHPTGQTTMSQGSASATQSASQPSGNQTAQSPESMHGGRLVYTVVSLGGFLGMGEKYALVPSNAVTFQSQRDYARLDTDKSTLEAIAFKSDEWPDMSSPAYARQVYSRFNEQPYWVALGYMSPSEEQETASQAWAADSPYNQCFNTQTIKTIQGTVESVGTFQPARGVREGLRLRIKTEDGKTITVNAGPQWYAQQQTFSLKSGDKVTITGSETKVNRRSVIMASKILDNGKTLDLRSDNGTPQWKWQAPASMPESMSSQPQNK